MRDVVVDCGRIFILAALALGLVINFAIADDYLSALRLPAVVKKGDSLWGIAKKFDVPVFALLIWNRIGIHHVIHPGQRLVVSLPPDKHAPEPTPSGKES